MVGIVLAGLDRENCSDVLGLLMKNVLTISCGWKCGCDGRVGGDKCFSETEYGGRFFIEEHMRKA